MFGFTSARDEVNERQADSIVCLQVKVNDRDQEIVRLKNAMTDYEVAVKAESYNTKQEIAQLDADVSGLLKHEMEAVALRQGIEKKNVKLESLQAEIDYATDRGDKFRLLNVGLREEIESAKAMISAKIIGHAETIKLKDSQVNDLEANLRSLGERYSQLTARNAETERENWELRKEVSRQSADSVKIQTSPDHSPPQGSLYDQFPILPPTAEEVVAFCESLHSIVHQFLATQSPVPDPTPDEPTEDLPPHVGLGGEDGLS